MLHYEAGISARLESLTALMLYFKCCCKWGECHCAYNETALYASKLIRLTDETAVYSNFGFAEFGTVILRILDLRFGHMFRVCVAFVSGGGGGGGVWLRCSSWLVAADKMWIL